MTNKSGKILAIDDNTVILDSLKQLLKYDFEEITTISDPKKLPELIEKENFDVILLDMNFKPGAHSGEEGLYWINKILKIDPDAVIILITAYGDIELAVQAIRAGGIDFILKPWETHKLVSTLRSAVKYRRTKLEVSHLKRKQKVLKEDIDQEFGTIISSSGNMQNILNTIAKVATTSANILITGEHGTGKELIAREIHRKSERSDEIFVKVDLGSLSETLFESELFGYSKGAFTDAKEDRTGRFESATGGTLFLDEIGNLSVSLQSKLLSAIQNRKITRIGSHKEIPVDIRLICATNRDLNEMVAQHQFREDLLYRINTIHIQIPPLRARPDDINILLQHFLKIYSKKYHKQDYRIGKEAMKELGSYNWPGNIRELKHTIEKAIILADNNILISEDFNLKTGQFPNDSQPDKLNLSAIEKEAIRKAFTLSGGNLSKAAKILDISRTTLYSKMEKHDL